MKDELDRRDKHARALEALFRSRPGVWIPWQELADVAGSCAWRTRASDLRTKHAMDIEWNRSVKASAYRWVPRAVREAIQQVDAARAQRLF